MTIDDLKKLDACSEAVVWCSTQPGAGPRRGGMTMTQRKNYDHADGAKIPGGGWHMARCGKRVSWLSISTIPTCPTCKRLIAVGHRRGGELKMMAVK